MRKNGTTKVDEEGKENRFSHLLQPIRDLAQNWNVDIAKELEEYLEEVASISIVHNNLNFAEAALLIQGSVNIWGRKVEYLHKLIFQHLETLNKKKKKQENQDKKKSRNRTRT